MDAYWASVIEGSFETRLMSVDYFVIVILSFESPLCGRIENKHHKHGLLIVPGLLICSVFCVIPYHWTAR